jgi:hypothetical protein
MSVSFHSVFETVEGLVALGTILLAFGTLGVALLTRSTALATKKLAEETHGLVDETARLAEVSAEEVEMSRRAIEAEVKPLILDWPADNRTVTVKHVVDEGVLISVPAVNANATALIQSVTMHWQERGAPASTRIGWPTVLAVGPGGETEARFHFEKSEIARLDAIGQLGKFSVEIEYTDAAGGQRDVTRFEIYRASETETWRIWAVSFRRVGESEPYAEARPVNR